jgi:YVTN family beta-propeller protein
MSVDKTLKQEKVVPVGAGPHGHIGYAGWLDRVWVLNSGETTITALDGTSGDVLGRIDVHGRPLHLILDAATGHGYVPLEEDTLAIVDVKNGEVAEEIALPEGTGRSCLLPMLGNHRLYIVSENLPALTVIDTAERKIVGSIPVGGGAQWGQPHGKTCGKLYVAGSESDDVTIIDEKNEKVITTVPTGARPVRAAIFREQGKVFTADWAGHTVTAIGIDDDTVRATVPVGKNPARLVGMQKKTGRPELWVLNRGTNAQSHGTISVVDASEDVALEPIQTVDSPVNWLLNGPIAHVVSTVGRQMMILDSRSAEVVDVLALSEAPDPVSFSNMVFSNSGNLFVANEGGTATLLTPGN